MAKEEKDLPDSNPVRRGWLMKWVIGPLVGAGLPLAPIAYLLGESRIAAIIGGCTATLLIIVSVRHGVVAKRQVQRFLLEYHRGLIALARGELQIAFDTFWKWAESALSPPWAAASRHGLAWTLMRRGDLQRAMRVAAENMRLHEGVMATTGDAERGSVVIALCCALTGELDTAERWFQEAHQQARDQERLTGSATYVLARAVQHCRAGRPREAAQVIDEQWITHQLCSGGDILRPLRVVRAFALATADLRNAGVVQTEAATLLPLYAGEYELLGAAWPEMSSFLVMHKLARSPLAA